jgi:competence protein ComEA
MLTIDMDDPGWCGGVGIMNKKERFAGAILVLTLAVGITVNVLERRGCGPASCGVSVAADTAAAQIPAAADSSGAAKGAPDGGYRRLDINAATDRELMLLPGIGPKKAEAILAWRRANGPFATVDGLLEVKGIGTGTLGRLRPFITVTK